MARKIICEDAGPEKIEVGGETKFICMCGLTKKKPYCDGAHRMTRDEEDDKTYEYQDDGSRIEV